MIPLSTKLEDLRKEGKIGVRAENCLAEVGIFTIGEVIERFKPHYDLMMSLSKFGRKSYVEITNVLEEVDKDADETATGNQEEGKAEENNKLIDELSTFSDSKREYIEEAFQKALVSEQFLRVRAQNGLRNAKITLEDVLRLDGKERGEYFRFSDIRHVGRKSIDDIYKFSQKFLSLYKDIASMKDEDIVVLRLHNEFPFMSYAEVIDCNDFALRNGHLPMFFVLKSYLMSSSSKPVKVYAMHHGISTPYSLPLDEVGERLDLSKERVRQIIKSLMQDVAADPMLEHIIGHKDWKHYELICAADLIFDNTFEWLLVQKNELPDTDFKRFVWVAALLPQFDAIEFGSLAILKNVKCGIDVKGIYDKLESIVSDKYYDDAFLDVNILVEDTAMTTSEFVQKVVKVLIEGRDGMILSGNRLFISQNAVDIEHELCKILTERNNKVSLDELTNEYNSRVGHIKPCKKAQVKNQILGSKRISACGKSGYYGLSEWEHVYYGTIRDLVYETLAASELPVHIKTIMEKVSVHFENTTPASVSASMESDTNKRFVKFDEGYFGLADKNYPESFTRYIKTLYSYSFEQRIELFRNFVNDYHRYPLSGGGDVEAALYRWHYNVSNRVISTLTEEQTNQFWQMLEDFEKSLTPRNNDEYRFFCRCLEYIEFTNQKGHLPGTADGKELYAWYKKHNEIYHNFSDFRRNYFEGLIDFASKYQN